MSEMVANVYTLLALHMLGDYVLQTDFLAKTKGKNPWNLLAHCVTYTLPFAIAYGIDWRIAFLLATHSAVDALKARYGKITYAQDQAAHLLVLTVYLFEGVKCI